MKTFEPIPPETERVAKVVVNAAFQVHKEMCLDVGLRLDMLVEKQVLVELKAVEAMIPLFDAQLLSYLKLTKQRLGLLINFNVPLIKNGIKRIIL